MLHINPQPAHIPAPQSSQPLRFLGHSVGTPRRTICFWSEPSSHTPTSGMCSRFSPVERAYQQRDSGLNGIAYDPLLAGLQSNPRYGALLKKLELAD
jgi:hypothetical protein